MKYTDANTYDYIVVGGGSAGCVMAKRLCEDGDKKILLLEAGGNGDNPFIKMPAGNGFLFGNSNFDWGYQSVPQTQLYQRSIYYPRGRALGGSSIMNGMLHIRGNAQDYDNWSLPGWRYQELLPYFKKLETVTHQDNNYHGHSGPVKITPASNFGELDQVFIDAAQQAGYEYNDDFNAQQQNGVGLVDVTVHNGQRQSTALTYLSDYRAYKNLTIQTNAIAHKLKFRGLKATGIRYSLGADIKTACATNEIILCLGSFGTPQLLMLSGIGESKELETHEIKIVANLPGVGKNLHDHINYPMQYGCTDAALTLAQFQRLDRAVGIGIKYLFNKNGPCANPFWSTHLFFGLDKTNPVPDFQAMFTRMIMKETPRNRSKFDIRNLGGHILARGKQAESGFQLDINQMHPRARGSITLKSKNPLDHPVIDPKFLSVKKDCTDLIEGIKIMRNVVSQSAFDKYRGKEFQPGPLAQSDALLLESIRKCATTGHHPVGTCKMGTADDKMAVVDPTFRVYGVEHLRIVDGSIMPKITTGNTNTPIIAFAEKAAELILNKNSMLPKHRNDNSEDV